MVKRIKKVAKPNAAQEIGKPHHIVFGFRYLHPTSYPDCNNSAFFIKFLKRLQQLSTITWEQANVADRHSFGYEKIPVEQIKSHVNLTEDVRTLVAFRATGDNHVFLGIREADVFQVVFIESSFGDIYNH
jgi:hypothetical protein